MKKPFDPRRRDFLGFLLAGWGLSKGHARYPPRILGFPDSRAFRPGDSGILVKVLGTAQDGGIPQMGCRCPNCLRAHADPRRVRFIASLAVVDLREKTFFLIDATPDIRPQLEEACRVFGPEPPDLKRSLGGVCLTHAHIGHYTGLMFFGYEAASMRRLPVFGSSGMTAFLTDNGPWSQLVELENIALKPFAPDESFSLTPAVSLTPIKVPHRDEFTDTFAFIVSGPEKRLLYIPDIQSWEAWERSLLDAIGHVDVALLDGTFFGRGELPGRDISEIGHPLIVDSCQRLRGLRPEKKRAIFFTHFNHSNPVLDPEGEERNHVEESGFVLAEDGQIFSL